MTTWKATVSTARTKKKISAASAPKASACRTTANFSYPAKKPGRVLASHHSAPNAPLSKSGKARVVRSARRMVIPLLRPPGAPRRAEAQDVLDPDDEVHHAEAGDEPPHERIGGQDGHREVRLQQRIHGPDARPR